MQALRDRTSIHLNHDSVQIETVRDGRTSIKNTNIEALQEVLTRGERIETPLLPSVWGVQKYTKINNREQFVLTTPASMQKVKYDYRGDANRRIVEYEIPVPPMVYLFHTELRPSGERKYIHGMAYALKGQLISMNERLFVFPFANVSGSYICWGDRSPEISGSKSLQTIPDRLWANPFNNDLDDHKFSEFQDEVNGRTINRFRTSHFFEYLDRVTKEAIAEGKEPSFKYDALRSAGQTLESVIADFRRSYLNA